MKWGRGGPRQPFGVGDGVMEVRGLQPGGRELEVCDGRLREAEGPGSGSVHWFGSHIQIGPRVR